MGGVEARSHGESQGGAGLALVAGNHIVASVGDDVFLPLVQGAPPCIHEKVCHGRDLQSQLLSNGGLHLLAGTFGFLEDGM